MNACELGGRTRIDLRAAFGSCYSPRRKPASLPARFDGRARGMVE